MVKVKRIFTELIRPHKLTKCRGFAIVNKAQYVLHKEVNEKMSQRKAEKPWDQELAEGTSHSVQ